MKQTICVDFDGTIVEHKFPAIGALRPGALDALKKLHKRYRIIISSCRSAAAFGGSKSQSYKEMVDFIKENNIPHDDIDDGTNGKIIAIAYIDDRAINAISSSWPDIANTLF